MNILPFFQIQILTKPQLFLEMFVVRVLERRLQLILFLFVYSQLDPKRHTIMSDEEDVPDNVSQRSDILIQMMDDIVLKLKLLEYPSSSKALCNPTSFVLPSNTTGQFKAYMDLIVFLMHACDEMDFTIDKYDDPMTSLNKLMSSCTKLNIEHNFPLTKYKGGYGEANITLLSALCTKALVSKSFTFAIPVYPKENFAENAQVDEDAEIDDDDDDGVEENVHEEEILYSDLNRPTAENADDLDESYNQIITATVNPLEWKTEVERVGPKLKARIKGDGGKEWRHHSEATKKYKEVWVC